MSKALTKRPIEVAKRRLLQDMGLAVRDVYDALVELVTNSDDRYQRLTELGENHTGRIEIEVERRRGDSPTVVRVRDFADGMTLSDMDQKLARTGDRVSGLETGACVRGTNSRGAKDIQALGSVRFDSIASEDGKVHCCRLANLDYEPLGTRDVTANDRRALGIKKGSGTLVTIELRPGITIPQHDTMLDQLRRRVALRDILCANDRTVKLTDLNQNRQDTVKAPYIEANDRLKETFDVPGYPGATAKLIIRRAQMQYQNEHAPYRLGGIIVKSRHAIHESTYFDPKLARDPHAAWFVGRLRCEYIDHLWTEYDNIIEAGENPPESNPFPILDPLRRTGLVREHPFAEALFREVLKRFRPLVEEERKQAESERVKIENSQTRKRLDELEKLASTFLRDETDIEESAREPNAYDRSALLRERGYTLSPPFCKLVVGKPQKFWLNINSDVFREIQEGDTVQVSRLSQDVSAHPNMMELEPHPADPKILRAVWTVTGESPTPASGIRASVGPIKAEATMEVLATEADRFSHITQLQFSSKRYKIPVDGSRKNVKVYCPIASAPDGGELELVSIGRAFKIKGHRHLKPKPELGIASATFGIVTSTPDARGVIKVRWGDEVAEAELLAGARPGTGIKINLEDKDFGAQRSRWNSNVLEIAARHPSIRAFSSHL